MSVFIPALLILTINDIHPSITSFIKTNKIMTYIHAKNKENINKYCQQYIIKKYVATKWGDISLIHATIALLSAAIKNNCTYFILISGDTLLNTNLLNNIYARAIRIKSIFTKATLIYNNNPELPMFYKTSQWWCMNKPDADIIINTYKKYLPNFTHKLIRGIGAPDELFFLTVLQNNAKQCGKKYSCYYGITVHSRWIMYTVKHPTIFNKLTKYDYMEYKKTIVGLRKCTQLCSIVSQITKHNNVIIIAIIGTHADQKHFHSTFDYENADLIVLTPLEQTQIYQEIKDRAVSITFFYYGDKDNFIKIYLEKMSKYLRQWRNVKILDLEL